MIPTTYGAFIALLSLIAPGIVFQLRREAIRPGFAESTFHELSRVVLTSLVFTSLSVVLLAIFRLALPQALIDPRAWLTQGSNYLKGHLLVVALTLAIEVVLACLLAAAAAQVTPRHRRAKISPFSTWYLVLRRDRPPETRPWVTLHLTDGTELSGQLRHYTESCVLENQEIAIGGPRLTVVSPQGEVSKVGTASDAIVVRGEQIQYMVVRYENRLGQLFRRRTTKFPGGKLIQEKMVYRTTDLQDRKSIAS